MLKIRTKVRGGGGTANDAGFELIDSITLEEDTNIIDLLFEPDGKPYNFKSVIVKFDFINGNYGTNYKVILNSNDKNIITVNPYVSENSERRYMSYWFLNIHGIILPLFSLPVSRYTPSANIQLLRPDYTNIYVEKNITEIKISGNTESNYIKAGTKIYLYAVRA